MLLWPSWLDETKVFLGLENEASARERINELDDSYPKSLHGKNVLNITLGKGSKGLMPNCLSRFYKHLKVRLTRK